MVPRGTSDTRDTTVGRALVRYLDNVEKGFGFVAPGPRRQGRFVHATLDLSCSISGRVGDYEPRLGGLQIEQFIREMNSCCLSAED
jgi:hypothetical protein